MYSFESSPSRKPLHAMVIAAFVAAGVLFGLSGIPGVPYPVIFQTATVLCLVVAVYLVARYAVRVYRYALEPNGIVDAFGAEQCDLVITERIGKKQKVVARIALRDIDKAVAVDRKNGEARKAARDELCRGKQVFLYANTPILPAECYLSLPAEGAVIVIPADRTMTAILQRKE